MDTDLTRLINTFTQLGIEHEVCNEDEETEGVYQTCLYSYPEDVCDLDWQGKPMLCYYFHSITGKYQNLSLFGEQS
jgi:hypothetical protein